MLLFSFLQILLAIALPACLAQFSIKGPSDGNRAAQGLRVTEGKGIEYTDQNVSNDSGFTIQGASDGHSQVHGASDGNSNFQIQGATDGHSNFQIQGATSAGTDTYNFQQPTLGSYNIQGATDGNSQSIIQGSYEPSAKSLQYNDPSGLRVNWRSYDRQPRPGAHQELQQYSEAPIASVPRAQPHQRAHVPRQHEPQPQPQPVQPIQPQRSYDSAPSQIKQILQYQAQLPYLNIIPEHYRIDALLQSQREQEQQQPQYQPEPQEHVAVEPRRPAYRGKSRGPPRHRRQAQQHGQQQQQQQQQPYRRVSQPPADPPIRYSTNLPSQIQQYLKFQAQTPYINVIPEHYRFNPDPSAQAQLEEFRKHYQELLRQQPTSPIVTAAEPARTSIPVRGQDQGSLEQAHSRQRRQIQHQQQQLPAEPVPQYSTNLPSSLQNILQYQAQIPYNIIANQINYRPEKPYEPQPVQPSAPSQQSQLYRGDGYQGQQSGHNQVYASQPQYPQYSQAQSGYQQAGDSVRPVTENQY
ncbi:hypothetical protein ANTRET_LOCUS7183 [Anthophora retusa]